MSIKLMAAAWDLQIGSTEKFVLMCLCDHANDDGICWPSISRICEKVSKSERTVQGALKWLCDNGYFEFSDGDHKSRTYSLDPRKICTPQNLHPAEIAKHPRRNCKIPPQNLRPNHNRTIKEPPLKNIRARENIFCPEGVTEQVWADFQKHRKAKRAPVTQTVIDGITKEAAKAGWNLNDALAECTIRGWQSFKADWVKENGNTQNGNSQHGRTINAIGVALGSSYRDEGRDLTLGQKANLMLPGRHE
jgi:hypothetical protein